MRRFASHKDTLHRPIVNVLRMSGASVEVIEGRAGTPDLIVGMFGQTELIEVKSGERAARRKSATADAQRDWMRTWRGRPVLVVTSIDEALALVSRMRGAMTLSEVAS